MKTKLIQELYSEKLNSENQTLSLSNKEKEILKKEQFFLDNLASAIENLPEKKMNNTLRLVLWSRLNASPIHLWQFLISIFLIIITPISFLKSLTYYGSVNVDESVILGIYLLYSFFIIAILFAFGISLLESSNKILKKFLEQIETYIYSKKKV